MTNNTPDPDHYYRAMDCGRCGENDWCDIYGVCAECYPHLQDWLEEEAERHYRAEAEKGRPSDDY